MKDDSTAREEAQEYYVRKWEKARAFRLSGQPERRGKKRHSWGPHHWMRNDHYMAYRNLRSVVAG